MASGQVLECYYGGGDAYIRKDFAAAADVYVTFDIRFDAAGLANQVPDANVPGLIGTNAFLLQRKADHVFSGSQGIFLRYSGGAWHWFFIETDGAETEFGTVVGDTWYHLGVRERFAAGVGHTTIEVDGVDSGYGEIAHTALSDDTDGWWIGPRGSNFQPGYIYIDSLKIGTTGFDSTDIFSTEFEFADPLDEFDDATGALTLIDNPGATTPPGSGSRFYRNPDWRYVVFNRSDDAIVTFLDRHATNRNLVYTLNQAAVATGDVPSDEPEINIPYQLVTNPPFMHHNSRFLRCFRREGIITGDPPNDFPWVCRFAGIIMQLEDEGDDAPTTHFTAYDPLQYMFNRPVTVDGEIPEEQEGLILSGSGTNNIIALLEETEAAHGPTFIDWGQSAFYDGTLELTPSVIVNAERGMSVGEAIQQVTDSGTCDIFLKPIYDPENRPGILCELSVYERLGETKHEAVFAWDKPSRSLVGISRLIDGTQLVNEFQGYAGQGGDPVTKQVDTSSVARYGQYWAQQFLPGKEDWSDWVELLALALMKQRVNGQRTVSFSAAPERSPLPFQEFYLGDNVPVWASRRFRDPMEPQYVSPPKQYGRVIGIPLAINDDGVEELTDILVAVDSGTVSGSGAGSGLGGPPCVGEETYTCSTDGNGLFYWDPTSGSGTPDCEENPGGDWLCVATHQDGTYSFVAIGGARNGESISCGPNDDWCDPSC